MITGKMSRRQFRLAMKGSLGMTQMKKRILGRTGFEVSELGLGTWPIGGVSYDAVTEKEAWACIEAYLDGGGNFLDSALGYGDAQRFIGQVLAKRGSREQVFIASKTHNSASLETLPKVRGDLEKSLRDLQTEYIDLYYLHWPPDDPDQMRRVLDEYLKFKDEGKIRSIGASIRGPVVSAETLQLCRQYIDTGAVDAIQVVYSILRQMNREIFDYAAGAGVAVVARTAIESGFLSGKYKPGHRFDKGHRGKHSADIQEHLLEAAQELAELTVKPPYEKLAQVAIKFSLEPKNISMLLMGARSAQQVQELLRTVSMPDLPTELMDSLKERYGERTLEYNPEKYTPLMMGKK